MCEDLQHGKRELPPQACFHFQQALLDSVQQSQQCKLRMARQARFIQQQDLLAWSRNYLPHYFKRPPSGMHRWIGDQLARAEMRGLKLNVVGPRGSAKSTLVTLAYALRAAVQGTERYIWIISDTRHQAAVHLENLCGELTENRALRRDHPQALAKPPRVRGNVVRLASGVTIEAYGTGQRLRGKRRREHRPTLILCDDLQNDDHISSAWQRARSREWFQGTLLKAGTRTTNIINLATALHRDALAMELCRTPGWQSMVFQAIESWPNNMLLWHAWEQIYANLEDPHRAEAAEKFYQSHRQQMDEGARLLWPEVEDLITLMQMRAEGGRVAFEREKQGSPFDPSRCEWPEEYFEEPLWFDQWPTDLQARVLALDPSKGSDARRGDYSAYVLLGVDRENRLYVEADLQRRATPQMVADGVELVRTFQPDAFGVEGNQFQQLLGESFMAELDRQKLVHVRPWMIENTVNKQVRIRRLGALLAAHRVRFKANSPGTQLLVEQLREFPQGDHDDGPDALEMAVRLAGELLGAVPTDGLGDRLL